MKDLILVIDMQNVYGHGMAWECANIDRTKHNIHSLLSSGCDAAFTVFDPPFPAVGAWNEYNRVNKDINEDIKAGELMDEFKTYLPKFPLFRKMTYSSLSVPSLRKLMAEYDRVVVTGVVAECCVLSTVMSLIDLGIPFVYVPDAVSGISDRTEDDTKEIISYMTPVHGSILSVKEYLNLQIG